MRIGVIGAGAMGGLVGGKLALAGHDLSIIDVGAHLEAIQQRGLQLWSTDDTQSIIQPTLGRPKRT